ncbi:lipopolysaccharide biosynthesis protein [Providencia rettgeri]
MNLFNNTKWVTIAQAGKILVQILSLTILTRLISPSDYGLMAIAFVVMNLAIIIRDLGTASALIQRKDLEHDIVNAVFWLNIIVGISLSIIVALFSPLISNIFQNTKIQNVLLLLCISFPLASSGSAHQALLERNSLFKKVALIELFSGFIGLISAITIAYLNGGVYALVFQVIISTTISSSLMFYFSDWKPTLDFNFRKLKSILSFSGNLTIFNLVNFFSRNLDNIIVGKKFDVNTLGIYSLAYRIMLFPLQSITFIASRSLYPILSRNQEDLLFIKTTYVKTILIVSSLTIPMMAGLSYLREPFINIIFGSQWSEMAILLVWLAPTGVIQSILSCSGCILMATNHSKELMLLGIFGAILQVSFFIIGSFYNIETFVILYFVANIINAFPVLYWTLKSINLKIINYLVCFISPLLATSIMIIILHYIQLTFALINSSEPFIFFPVFYLESSYIQSLY